MSIIIFLLSLFGTTVFLLASGHKPKPKFVGYVKGTVSDNKLASAGDYAWENSGQFEGDIMIYKNKDERDMNVKRLIKNSMINSQSKFKKGIVPYRIVKKEFSAKDAELIKESMSTISNQTCIIFRKFKSLDRSFIVFRSNDSGCWSSIGRRPGGQVLNLNRPYCIRKPIIVHELLHALGFFHQHSTYNRNDFIKIHWENIDKDERQNFKRYSEFMVSNLGTKYDYKSIMHYSPKALSMNGKDTITPLKPGIELGGKVLTKTDIVKIRRRYKKECESRENSDY